MQIGFIGQGWIGKNYADNFEDRGYDVTRYDVSDEFKHNKDKIKECDFVFIAVPTPSRNGEFDFSIVDDVLSLVGNTKIAIIKSTVLPGTTAELQKKHPKITVLHSPEFLTEKTARYDADHPDRNIIGYVSNRGYIDANLVMDILPEAPYKAVLPAKEAEMIKYAGNNWFYFKVVFMNLLYDLCKKQNIDFEAVKRSMSFDPRIGFTHLDADHQGGRGAGGHCFVKDFAAFASMYRDVVGDDLGVKLVDAMENKNIDLLVKSNKSIDLLKDVYSERFKVDKS